MFNKFTMIISDGITVLINVASTMHIDRVWEAILWHFHQMTVIGPNWWSQKYLLLHLTKPSPEPM